MRWQLAQLSWPELRHQPWRYASALLAVMLGVALAFSVHLINASALGEFSAAVRQVNGEADFTLRAQQDGFDERLYERVANHPEVALASPVVEAAVQALSADGSRVELRLIGQDALVAARIAPDLLPRVVEAKPESGSAATEPPSDLGPAAATSAADAGAAADATTTGTTHRPRALPKTTASSPPAAGPSTGAAAAPTDGVGPRLRTALVDPDALFLNPSAQQRLGGSALTLDLGGRDLRLPVRGTVAATGAPLAVIDIAGAQVHLGWLGRLSRIDVRLAPGADRDRVVAALALPAGVRAVDPGDASARISNISRAYRVNLTVLALVALFTGGFLVFSILSLSVARRLPQLALLGVLGLSGRERLALVLAESALLGAAGSALGVALGSGLAWAALRLLGGDLGGGYFAGASPTLQFSSVAALGYGALGIAAAGVGGWLPARSAQRMAPAQALKGYGSGAASRSSKWAAWLGPAGLAGGAALALLPPIGGLPLGAYVSVALLLLGGIACVPAAVGSLLGWLPPTQRPIWMLAMQRARHQRDAATIAVAGVVASLALSVALTVMVASFREAVTRWLEIVLPADVYARSAGGRSADSAPLAPDFATRVAALAPVARVETQRVLQLQLDPQRPPVALIARPLADPAAELPLVGKLAAAVPGTIAVYVSEAVVALYGARAGADWTLPLPDGRMQRVRVRGVWRDYARQSGAVMIAAVDFQHLTGDSRFNDLAIWLRPAGSIPALQAAIAALGDVRTAPVELTSTGEIRTRSLQLFDRSFAVTYWLQAVAIAIGLFGIAASFSAQVLARRKEFGLLVHLGLTRAQILALVAGEGALWTVVGTALGLSLGIAVSLVLVKVVNPQSFHWTMDLLLPWPRLALLCGAVLIAGTLTATLAARRAVSRNAALAVKEDW